MLDDYYGYFKEREMLVGQRTGRVIRAGQAVRVKLIGAHLDRLEIDLELVLDQKGAPRTDGQDGQDGSAPPRASRREQRAMEDRRRADQARQKRQGQGKSSGAKSPGGRNAVGQKIGGKKAGGPKSGSKRGGR